MTEEVRNWGPAGIGDGRNGGEGAVEEDGEEGSRANVDWGGANDVVVLGYPIGDEVAFWFGPPITVSGKRRRRRNSD